MDAAKIVAGLDLEIGRLQQARTLLTGMGAIQATKKRGRPKGSVSIQTKAGTARPAKKQHKMSAEARERIATAQRKRWAVQKGTTGFKRVSKKAAKATT